MNPADEFKKEKREQIAAIGNDPVARSLTHQWFNHVSRAKYSYNFEWLGRPIIQFPQDIIAMQEIIFRCKPDLIVETGIAHGGSLIFSASMLELNAACGGPADAEVVAVDIDIRAHNREAILAHPLSRRITMFEGSSIDPSIIDCVRAKAPGRTCVLVCLDSNHTHAHVLAELKAYADLVTVGSYCVVFDTCIEDMPADFFPDRPWGIGDNPKTAVQAFLQENDHFAVDQEIDSKLLISVAPGGYLKRVR